MAQPLEKGRKTSLTLGFWEKQGYGRLSPPPGANGNDDVKALRHAGMKAFSNAHGQCLIEKA
jgi:hypothetical protein